MTNSMTRREYVESTRKQGDDHRNYIELTSDDDGKVRNIELRIAGTYKYFQVGTVKKGDEGRQTHGGDMVPGPWAYAFGLGSMMTDVRTARTPSIDVREGDVIYLDGEYYYLSVKRREYISLENLAEDGSRTNGSGW